TLGRCPAGPRGGPRRPCVPAPRPTPRRTPSAAPGWLRDGLRSLVRPPRSALRGAKTGRPRRRLAIVAVKLSPVSRCFATGNNCGTWLNRATSKSGVLSRTDKSGLAHGMERRYHAGRWNLPAAGGNTMARYVGVVPLLVIVALIGWLLLSDVLTGAHSKPP